MKLAKHVIPATILLGAVLVALSGPCLAKPEYTKKEKKACATCHVSATSKELNSVGKYYKEHKTLEGAPPATSVAK